MTTLERIPSGVAAPTTTVSDVMALARESGVLMSISGSSTCPARPSTSASR